MPKVLIVDDSSIMRNLLRKQLTEMGCEVVGEAADGEEAVKRYRALRPDVVTMDIVLPSGTGMDVIKKIRLEDPKAKIIMVSAMDQEKAVMEALCLGACGYVVKPAKAAALKEEIEKIMNLEKIQ